MDDGMVLLPNDRYPLDRDVFRIYYTSECEDQQTIDIYFEDNHDQFYQLFGWRYYQTLQDARMSCVSIGLYAEPDTIDA